MSPEELNTWLKRRPYIPLRVHIAETTHYDILNPEMAVVGRTCLFIGLTREVDSELFDEPVMVSMRHITKVDPIIEKASATSA